MTTKQIPRFSNWVIHEFSFGNISHRNLDDIILRDIEKKKGTGDSSYKPQDKSQHRISRDDYGNRQQHFSSRVTGLSLDEEDTSVVSTFSRHGPTRSLVIEPSMAIDESASEQHPPHELLQAHRLFGQVHFPPQHNFGSLTDGTFSKPYVTSRR
jgi:hypothetical protein